MKFTWEQVAKGIWQHEIDDNQHDDEFVDILYEAEATHLLKLIETLSEEAFRAGFMAAWEYMRGYTGIHVGHEIVIDQAWDDYEPSEAVKELIDG